MQAYSLCSLTFNSGICTLFFFPRRIVYLFIYFLNCPTKEEEKTYILQYIELGVRLLHTWLRFCFTFNRLLCQKIFVVWQSCAQENQLTTATNQKTRKFLNTVLMDCIAQCLILRYSGRGNFAPETGIMARLLLIRYICLLLFIFFDSPMCSYTLLVPTKVIAMELYIRKYGLFLPVNYLGSNISFPVWLPTLPYKAIGRKF